MKKAKIRATFTEVFGCPPRKPTVWAGVLTLRLRRVARMTVSGRQGQARSRGNGDWGYAYIGEPRWRHSLARSCGGIFWPWLFPANKDDHNRSIWFSDLLLY